MSPARPGSRRVWWLLVALVVVCAAVAGVVLARDEEGPTTAGPKATPTSSTPAMTQAQLTATLSGRASTVTRTFAAAENWELRWGTQAGSGFRVELLKADGTSRGVLVTAGSKTSGSTFVGEAGTFKLKVTSKKPWTIEVRSRPTS